MDEASPNILWIVTTQWRAHACGYAGDINAHTPNIDALADGSLNYVQAVTPHPFGPFARAAMLTGVPSPKNGVGDYFDVLPESQRTVAHMMSEAGYRTAWFGKWHLWKRDREVPLVGDDHARIVVPAEARGGFGFWEGFESGFLLNNPWLHGTRLPNPVRFIGYQPDVLVDRVESWWEESEADPRPWFCVVSMEPPHPPYGEDAGMVLARDPDEMKMPYNVPAGSVEMRARREFAGYHAHITATDAAIGRLLRGLDRRPAGANTVVAFTSVHGDMHGAHGCFRKGWPYEESIRVPLLVRAPWMEEPARSEEPVSLLDLPEMSLAWAERRTWTCPRDHAIVSMPTVVDLPDQCDRVWRGVRTRSWKAIFRIDGEPWLVFDIARDPLETQNLLRHSGAGSILAAAYTIDLSDWMRNRSSQEV